MRIIVIIILVCAAIGIARHVPVEEIRSAESIGDLKALVEAPPDDAHVALEVRCGELEYWSREACRESLVARFSSGNATPQSVLRLHCMRVASVWDSQLPEPPTLCAERFGGWLSS